MILLPYVAESPQPMSSARKITMFGLVLSLEVAFVPATFARALLPCLDWLPS